MRRLKPFLKTATLFVVTCVVCVFLLELAVRLVAPQQLLVFRNDIWKPVPVWGHRHHVNVDTRVNVGEGNVHFVTDVNGWRVGAHADTTRTAEVNILALGDSFLEGLTVENDSTMVEFMRRRLEKDLGTSVRIANTGVGGWNPNHYRIEAEWALGRKQYDAGVVFVYTSNDIITRAVDSYPPRPFSAPDPLRFPRKLSKEEIVTRVLRPLNTWFSARSHFYVLFKNALRIQAAKAGIWGFYFPAVIMTSTAKSSRWETTAEVCRRIADAFDAHRVPVFFVLLPSHYQVDTDTYERYLDISGVAASETDLEQPNRLLAATFAERGLTLVDPLEHMRGKSTAGLAMYGRINKHFNDAGHRVVADYAYDALWQRVRSVLGRGKPDAE